MRWASLFGYIPLRKDLEVLLDRLSSTPACSLVFAMVRNEVGRRSRELQGGECDEQNFKMLFKVNDLNSRKEK